MAFHLLQLLLLSISFPLSSCTVSSLPPKTIGLRDFVAKAIGLKNSPLPPSDSGSPYETFGDKKFDPMTSSFRIAKSAYSQTNDGQYTEYPFPSLHLSSLMGPCTILVSSVQLL